MCRLLCGHKFSIYLPKYRGMKLWSYGKSMYLLSFFFNWRLIALQYCFGFCYTLAWISYGYIYIYPLPLEPPAPHPTLLGCLRPRVWVPWVTQQIPTGCLFYVWYWKRFHATLSICPILFSLPSHVCKSVLYVCVSIFALQIGSSVLSF